MLVHARWVGSLSALLLGMTFGKNPGLYPTAYPICAIYGDISLSAKICGFTNYADCRASIANKGRGGHCERNANYSAKAKPRREKATLE